MRKFSLLVLLGLCMFRLSGQVPRTILVESFSNPCCTPCVDQHLYLDSLMGSMGSRLVYIQYQTDWPCSSLNSNDLIKSRAKTYGLTSLPWLALNGKAVEGRHYKGAPMNLTKEILNQETKFTSPVQMTLSHYISNNGNTLTTTLTVKVIESFKGDYQAFIAIQEKEVVLASPDAPGGTYNSNLLCLALIPGEEGIILPAEMKEGDILIFTNSWELKGVHDPLQLCASAWIQNKQSKQPLQAAYSEPVGPDYKDVAINAISKPDKMICGSDLEPVVLIQNLGGKNLKTVEIAYSVNNGPVQRYTWTGDLPFLGKQEVRLPAISFTVLPTRNELKVLLTEPNQTTDFIPDNNELSAIFKAAPKSGIPMQIEILTDQYPGETSWKIRNASGQIVFQGGNYTNPNTVYQENLSFSSSDCYTFLIQDAGKDGIAGKYGKGHFTLRNQNGQIMTTGGAFLSEQIVPFEIDTKLEVPDIEISSDFTVFPNPFDNTATISIHISKAMSVKVRVSNEMGQVLFSQDNDELPAGNHIYELNGDNWAPGIYVIKVLTGDKLITKKLTLSK